MTNSLIPMGPSAHDIQEMARLRAILDGKSVPAVQEPIQAHYAGGYAGQRQTMNESRAHVAQPFIPNYGTSREDVDAMKNILNKLNSLSEDEEPSANPMLTEAASQPTSTSGPHEILITLAESDSGTEIRSYNVVDSGRRDVVSDLALRETAQAVVKLLNKGLDASSDRVREVLDLEETYNRNRLETAKHRSRYQRAMSLGESAAAGIFRNRFNEAKANALVAQDSIKSILESIR